MEKIGSQLVPIHNKARVVELGALYDRHKWEQDLRMSEKYIVQFKKKPWVETVL